MSNYYGFNGFPLPTGAILPIVVTNPNQIPDTFLYCDGSEYNSAVYRQLYAVIGDTYNTGGETEGYFRVPDLVTNPYIKCEPTVAPQPPFSRVVGVPITVANLPTLAPADFTVTDMTFTATSAPIFQHGGGFEAEIGTESPNIVTSSATQNSTFSVAYTGGSAGYFPPVAPTNAPATITFDDIKPEGYLFIHIIKAVQVAVDPQILAPAVVPQFPAPQYLYENMGWLNGFTDFQN